MIQLLRLESLKVRGSLGLVLPAGWGLGTEGGNEDWAAGQDRTHDLFVVVGPLRSMVSGF